MDDKNKKTTQPTKTNLLNQVPTITSFNNPKTIRSLEFDNRFNDSYTVKDIPLEEFVIGETRTYKDYIERALDPNTDDNAKMYGYAKEFKPLTQRLCDMKVDLNAANQALQQHLDNVVNTEQVPAENVNTNSSSATTEPAVNVDLGGNK